MPGLRQYRNWPRSQSNEAAFSFSFDLLKVDCREEALIIDLAPSLLKLRILILSLGEMHHAGWWKSQFLSPVGLSFLERIYPRSTFASAVRSACRAAQSVHDANVGKGDVFHLFRLPRQTEREIEVTLAARAGELETYFEPVIADREALLQALEASAGELPASSPLGPVRLSVRPEELVPRIAAVYYSAFREDVQTYPYFESGQVR